MKRDIDILKSRIGKNIEDTARIGSDIELNWNVVQISYHI